MAVPVEPLDEVEKRNDIQCRRWRWWRRKCRCPGVEPIAVVTVIFPVEPVPTVPTITESDRADMRVGRAAAKEYGDGASQMVPVDINVCTATSRGGVKEVIEGGEGGTPKVKPLRKWFRQAR